MSKIINLFLPLYLYTYKNSFINYFKYKKNVIHPFDSNLQISADNSSISSINRVRKLYDQWIYILTTALTNTVNHCIYIYETSKKTYLNSKPKLKFNKSYFLILAEETFVEGIFKDIVWNLSVNLKLLKSFVKVDLMQKG